VVCLAVAITFTAYLFSPLWWTEIGADARVLYAAGTLSARGGDPYNLASLEAEEDRLYNPAGTTRVFRHAPYGYPPLVTTALRAASGLSELHFYLATVALLLACGLGGFELFLSLLAWRGRALARVFFLASTPMALDVFVGNPSAILMLAAGAGAWWTARGRPFWGGVALALLAVKPQVGLPIAAAVLLAAPAAAAPSGHRLRAGLVAGLGLAAGLLVLAAAAVAFEGSSAFPRWAATLTSFGAALGPAGSGSEFSQSGLAGYPALMPFLPPAVAVVVAALVVAPPIAWTIWRKRDRMAGPTFAPLALAMAAALGVSPYLHMNDLILGALPLLVVAAARPRLIIGATLVLWAVGAPLRLVLAAALALAGVTFSASGRAGFGVILTATLLVSVIAVVNAPGQDPAGPAS
jgi:hypothetical protein